MKQRCLVLVGVLILGTHGASAPAQTFQFCGVQDGASVLNRSATVFAPADLSRFTDSRTASGNSNGPWTASVFIDANRLSADQRSLSHTVTVSNSFEYDGSGGEETATAGASDLVRFYFVTPTRFTITGTTQWGGSQNGAEPAAVRSEVLLDGSYGTVCDRTGNILALDNPAFVLTNSGKTLAIGRSMANPINGSWQVTGTFGPGLYSLRAVGHVQRGVLGSFNTSAHSDVTLRLGTPCGTADFDGDGDIGTDGDIEAFFRCLAGDCCAACFAGGADFNGDGDIGTDADIESFFRVLGGGDC